MKPCRRTGRLSRASTAGLNCGTNLSRCFTVSTCASVRQDSVPFFSSIAFCCNCGGIGDVNTASSRDGVLKANAAGVASATSTTQGNHLNVDMGLGIGSSVARQETAGNGRNGHGAAQPRSRFQARASTFAMSVR